MAMASKVPREEQKYGGEEMGKDTRQSPTACTQTLSKKVMHRNQVNDWLSKEMQYVQVGYNDNTSQYPTLRMRGRGDCLPTVRQTMTWERAQHPWGHCFSPALSF